MTACGVFASMTYDTHEHVDGVRIIFCRCATQLAGSYTHVVIIAMRAGCVLSTGLMFQLLNFVHYLLIFTIHRPSTVAPDALGPAF